MKRFASIVLVLFAFFTIAPMATIAQVGNPPTGQIIQAGNTAWYEVVSKDNPWKLFGPKWVRLTDLNDWLTTDNRIDYRSDDDVWVLINPGERLLLDGELKAILEARGVELIPVAPPPLGEMMKTAEKPAISTSSATTNEASLAPWWLGLGVLVALVLAYFLLRNLPERRRPDLPFLGRFNPSLTTDPVTAIPPMIPGGVRPDDHEAIRTQFREQAARSYTERYGVLPSLENVRIVSEITRGALYGVWQARDARGRWTSRRFNGERGFQAMVSVNNAEPTLLTWCQECANDLRGGTRYRGGRFVTLAAEEPIPASQPTAAQPVAHPALVARATRAAAEAEGYSTVTIVGDDRVMEFGRGAHFTVDPAKGTIGLEGQAFSMTIKPKRVRKDRHNHATATGTEGGK